MDVPQEEIVNRTIILADPTTVAKANLWQMGEQIRKYDRVILPSYLPETSPSEMEPFDLDGAMNGNDPESFNLRSQMQTMHHLLNGTYGNNVTVMGLDQRFVDRINQLKKDPKYAERLRNVTVGTQLGNQDLGGPLVRDNVIEPTDYLITNTDTPGVSTVSPNEAPKVEKEFEYEVARLRYADRSPGMRASKAETERYIEGSSRLERFMKERSTPEQRQQILSRDLSLETGVEQGKLVEDRNLEKPKARKVMGLDDEVDSLTKAEKVRKAEINARRLDEQRRNQGNALQRWWKSWTFKGLFKRDRQARDRDL